jgi:glycosyltransferase involved in cell wall biosynthesis
MKNIFIFWTEQLNEQRGGVHRVILLLLKHLPPRGFDVHYLYTLDDYMSFKLYNTDEGMEQEITVESLKAYLINNKCDIIIGQDGVFSSKLTRILSDLNLQNVTFINEYHGSLHYIMQKLTRDYLIFEHKYNNKWKVRISTLFKYAFYPLWKKWVWRNLAKSLRFNFLHSDISLLLSGREEPIVKSILPKGKSVNCIAIPNPLSWEHIENSSILQEKKKEVLVVARLYNPEKRIDLVLKIWKELQKRNLVHEWKLRIVGDGLHKSLLMDMAEKYKLENIVWEGWSDPKPFYRNASIFMMTSACEGWGLTLTESMQTGTVPLAIDTYPALHDIITNGYNGYIIKGNDVKNYADRMQFLIENPLEREKIALNGLESCKRFSTEKVMDMWAEMLNNLD